MADSTKPNKNFSVFSPSRVSDTPVDAVNSQAMGFGGLGTNTQKLNMAENDYYNKLYEKVMTDERAARVAKGLPADPPGFWERLKNKMLGRTEEDVARRKSEASLVKGSNAEDEDRSS